MRIDPFNPLVAAIAIATLLPAAVPNAAGAQGPQGPGLNAPPARQPLAHAIVEVERLDSLRSALAARFLQSGAPADQQAFTQVCKPVGQTMQRVATDNGWGMRQLSHKPRNPANAADAEAAAQLQAFLKSAALRSVVLTTTRDGQPALRYLRRITVEPACLLCHGDRASRPAFVVQNYPQDKAYNFKVGDLRGAYSVVMPQAAR